MFPTMPPVDPVPPQRAQLAAARAAGHRQPDDQAPGRVLPRLQRDARGLRRRSSRKGGRRARTRGPGWGRYVAPLRGSVSKDRGPTGRSELQVFGDGAVAGHHRVHVALRERDPVLGAFRPVQLASPQDDPTALRGRLAEVEHQ